MRVNSIDPSIPPEPGTYIVVLASSHTQELRIGRAGKLQQQPGYYFYVGSARGPGGLRARLGRHLRGSSKRRWHIDYLRAATNPWGAWIQLGKQHDEHLWADALIRNQGIISAMFGFGASDCRCVTHLFYSQRAPQPDILANTLRQANELQPLSIEWINFA